MPKRAFCLLLGLSCVGLHTEKAAQQPNQAVRSAAAQPFQWPNGKRAAVSLSFDDARPSQVDIGLARLNEHHVKVTFFVEAKNIHERLDGWKKAVADGH